MPLFTGLPPSSTANLNSRPVRMPSPAYRPVDRPDPVAPDMPVELSAMRPVAPSSHLAVSARTGLGQDIRDQCPDLVLRLP